MGVYKNLICTCNTKKGKIFIVLTHSIRLHMSLQQKEKLYHILTRSYTVCFNKEVRVRFMATEAAQVLKNTYRCMYIRTYVSCVVLKISITIVYTYIATYMHA